MKLLAFTIGPYKINTPTDITKIDVLSLSDIVHWIISLLLYVAILLSFIFVVVGGVKWIMSQGDKKGLDEARRTITLALGGLILALLAFFIVNLIGYAFGVPLLGGRWH